MTPSRYQCLHDEATVNNGPFGKPVEMREINAIVRQLKIVSALKSYRDPTKKEAASELATLK